MTKVLKTIQTQVGGQKVLTYSLAYDSSSGQSFLRGITLCGSLNGCLPTTTFARNSAGRPSGFTSWRSRGKVNTKSLTIEKCKKTLAMDANRDGLTDLVCVVGVGQGQVQTYVKLVNAKGGGYKDWITLGSASNVPGTKCAERTFAADMNGDGLDDLACIVATGQSSSRTYVQLLNADIRKVQAYSAWGLTFTSQDLTRCKLATTGDVNGDGAADLLCILQVGQSKFQSYVQLSRGVVPGKWQAWGRQWSGPASVAGCSQFFSGDANGDRLTDLFCVTSRGNNLSETYVQLSLQNTSGVASGDTWKQWSAAPSSSIPTCEITMPADVNRDGMTDLLCLTRNGTGATVFVLISTGVSSIGWRSWGNELKLSSPCSILTAGDVNNDGYSDVLCGINSTAGSGSWVLLSQTDGAGDWRTWGKSSTTVDVSACLFNDTGDLNGDGLTDLMCVAKTSSGENIFTQLGQFNFYEISRIKNGLNGTVSVAYSSISNPAVFQTGAENGTYPVRNVVDYSRVVQAYTLSDGRNSAADQVYTMTYVGNFQDVSGPGTLGFGMKTSVDGTGKKIRTVYNQLAANGTSSHLRGTVASTTLSKSGLKLTEWQYEYFNATAASLQLKGIRQPLRLKKTYAYYESGRIAYRLPTLYSYDAYGNLQMISEFGEKTALSPNVFTCSVYKNNKTNWSLGYLTARKKTKSAKACQKFLEASKKTAPVPFYSATDLSYEQYQYDDLYNLISEGDWDDANSIWLTTSYTVDAFGNRLTVKSPSDVVIQRTYDITYSTFPASTVSPNLCSGKKMTVLHTYEPYFGSQQIHQGANGNLFSFVTDDLGRNTSVSGPDPTNKGASTILNTVKRGSDVTGIYTRVSARIAWGDGKTSEHTNYIDGRGRVFRTTLPGQQSANPLQVDTVFNNRNLTLSRTLPYYAGDPAYPVAYFYDDYDRPILITDPDGTRQSLSYAYAGVSKGLQVKRTAAYGTVDASTEIRYLNGRGKPVKRVAPNGFMVSYVYDPLMRIATTTTSPAARSTRTVYDSLSRVRTRTETNTGTASFKYDGKGRLTSQTDGAGNKILVSGFDIIDRPLGHISTSEAGSIAAIYTYDQSTVTNGCGELTNTVQTGTKAGTIEYALGYDAYGNHSNRGMKIGGENYVSAFAYDPLQRLTQVVNPDGSRQRTVYRLDGHPASVDVALAGSSSFDSYVTYDSYDALGHPLSGSYRNGSTFSFKHYPIDGKATKSSVSTTPNSMGKLKGMVVKSKGKTLLQRSLNWNYLYAVTSVIDGTSASKSQNYQYDTYGMGFLNQAKGAYGTETYGYDSIGNVKTQNGKKLSYAKGTDLLTGGPNGRSFSYYDNGSLKSKSSEKGKTTYLYDAEGKLISAKVDGKLTPNTSEFAHDPGGATVFQQAAGSKTRTYYVSPFYEINDYGKGKLLKTHYVHGLHGPVAALTEPVDGGDVKKTGQSWWRKLLGTAGLGGWFGLFTLSGLLLFRRRPRCGPRGAFLIPLLVALLAVPPSVYAAPTGLKPGPNGAGNPVVGTRFFHQDQVGSTTAVTDRSGNVVASVSYRPYGSIYARGTKGTDDFRPKFGGVPYDYSLGHYRFPARNYDPLLGRFSSPDPAKQYYSPYMYAGNSPASYADPSGQYAEIIARHHHRCVFRCVGRGTFNESGSLELAFRRDMGRIARRSGSWRDRVRHWCRAHSSGRS